MALARPSRGFVTRRSSRGHAHVRRLPGALALIAAGILAPAGGALARSAPPANSPANSPAPLRLGVQPVDVPAAQAANPRALRSIIAHARPGTAIRREVLITNHSAVMAHVAVYPDAASITSGAFVGSPGRARNEVTAWTRTSRPNLILGPHATAKVAVSIAVPKDVPAGERYGVIFAQETSHLPIRDGFTISEVNRVGVRIYLLVGGGSAAQTDFAVGPPSMAQSADGRPVADAGVRNTGRRAVDLTGYLTLSNSGGLRAGPFWTQLGTTLAPGQSGQVQLELGNRLPGGLWHARLVLVSGLTQRRADATVRVANPAGTGPHGTSGYLIAAVGVVTLCALLISVARRRSR